MVSMKNCVNVIEISHKFLKLVVGNYFNGKVSVRYVKKIPISGLIENGRIKDKEGLIAQISKLNPIEDESFEMNKLIDEAVVVLPPYGLEIYNTTQLTSVISRERIIGYQDIVNIYSIISNKKLPVDNELIDIIPQTFTIDSGEKYAVAPIGKASRSIDVSANVFTLPKSVNNDYSEVFERAGIKIAHKVVSTFALSELLRTYDGIPNDYFLIDMGANSTSVSLVGQNLLLGSRSFAYGGENITERIVECFNINENEAEKVKKLYGYDTREMKFAYPICKSGDKEHFGKELNEIIAESLDQFISHAKAAMDQLATTYKVGEVENVPLLLVGGAAKLHGLLEYLKAKMGRDNIEVVTPTTLGARDLSLFTSLGAIIVHIKHPGIVEDINSSSTPVNREE